MISAGLNMPQIYRRSDPRAPVQATAPPKGNGLRILGLIMLLGGLVYGGDGVYGLNVGVPKALASYREFGSGITAGEEEMRRAEDSKGELSDAAKKRRSIAGLIQNFDKTSAPTLYLSAWIQVALGSAIAVLGLVFIVARRRGPIQIGSPNP